MPRPLITGFRDRAGGSAPAAATPKPMRPARPKTPRININMGGGGNDRNRKRKKKNKGLGDDLGLDESGPGTNAYNDAIGAVDAGLATLRSQGVGAPALPGAPLSMPGAGAQNEWLNRNMQQLYQEFEGYRRGTPGAGATTWTQFLQNKFGAPNPANRGLQMPGDMGGTGTSWDQNMARYFRSEFSRANPADYRYFPDTLVGPGRTVTN